MKLNHHIGQMNAFTLSILCLFFAVLVGCTKITDFVEGGEDNTEKPNAVMPIKQKWAIKKNWTRSVGGSRQDKYVKLTPVMVNQLIISAQENGAITALSRDTGQVVWQAKLRQTISGGLAATQDAIFLVTHDGHVVSLNNRNGVKRWQADVADEMIARPAVAGNKIIIKTIDDKIIALNAADGKTVWRYLHPHQNASFGLRASSAPQVVGNKVVVGLSDGKLAVLELATGQLLWMRSLALPHGVSQVERVVSIVAEPVITNGVIYVASYQGAVAAIELASGRDIWQHEMSVYSGLSVDAHHVYVSDARGHIWSLQRQTGQVLWRQKDLNGHSLTAPVLADNAIVVAGTGGHVHWLSRVDGRFLARAQTGSDSDTVVSPLVVGQKVYVLNQAGVLTSYDVQQQG